jgi:hypothetical protein
MSQVPRSIIALSTVAQVRPLFMSTAAIFTVVSTTLPNARRISRDRPQAACRQNQGQDGTPCALLLIDIIVASWWPMIAPMLKATTQKRA